MLVENMTIQEVRRELDAELPDLANTTIRLQKEYERYLKSKLRRINSARQRQLFRSPKTYRFRTAQKNNYLLTFDRDELDYLTTYVVYFQSKKGLTAYMINAPIDWQNIRCGSLTRYTGHFFKRYRERCQIGNKTPLQVMESFFKKNARVGCIPHEKITDGVHRIYTPIKDGLCLGFSDQEKQLFVLNTFLSFDEMKGDQKDAHKQIASEYRDLLKTGKLTADDIFTAKRILADLDR